MNERQGSAWMKEPMGGACTCLSVERQDGRKKESENLC